MKVVGFSFNKISIEREKEGDSITNKDIKINTHVEILDVVKTPMDLIKNSNLFNFKYQFKVIYTPNIASLNFEGSILINISDDTIAKKIDKEWKDKTILEEVRIPLLNAIYSKCNLKAFQLEDDLNLPLHMPIPKLVSLSKDDLTNIKSTEGKNKK